MQICPAYQLSGLSVLICIKLIKLYKNEIIQKIRAKRESGLTTVWLKRDPPVHAPVMLRDFIEQYQESRITATKWESPTFINSFLIDLLVFIAAILTVFIILIIIYIVTGQSKLKVSVTTMALQRVRAVEALNTNRQTKNCNSELLKVLMVLNLVIVVSLLLRKIKKSVFF